MLKKFYLIIPLLTALLCFGAGNAWGDEITVADGTTTNQYVPFYGYYADQTGMRSQIIYLAADLEEMVGGTISKLTFYSSTSSWTNTATFTLSLAEVDATSLSAIDGTTVLTLVKSGYTLSSNAGGKLEITFTDPFVYSEGKNLLVDLTMTNKGSEKSKYYYGVTASGASYLKYGSSGYTTSPNFRPKATFTYEPGAAGGCAKPKALTKGAVTATSATFTWTAGGSETSWQWICLPAATAVDWNSSAVQTATSATATATGLSAETNYKFYVRANCDSEQSAEVSKAFTTPCTGASLPYEQNFDGEATNTIPSCWAKFAYVSGDYSYPFVYSGGVTGNCMYFYGGGATSAQTIILPPMAEPTNTLLLSFSYKNSSTSTSYGQAKIGYVTDPEDASTFVALTGGSLTRTTSWTEVKKFALTGAPANSYIAIQLSGGGSYYNSQRLYIDDLKVSLPSSCTDPSGVSAVAASATSATVSWTENGSATAWNIQYSTDNFATHTDVNNVTTNPYTITGLSGNTTYKVRVQANCGSEQSDWVVSEAFETPCEPTTGIGWTADFAGASTGSAAGLPSCWVKNSTNSYPYIYQYGARSNSRCLYFGGNSSNQPIAVLPPFSEETNTLYVTLWYNNAYEYGDYSASSYGQLAIGYMTNPADASTFVAQELMPRVNMYKQAKVALTDAPAGSRVAIRYVSEGSSTGYLFVDDIAITAIPSCVDPSGVTGSATSTEEASISWTENGTATAWQVRYSSDNGETWSDAVNASTNPFILTGLSAKTTYIAQVKAKCGEEEFSEWSASSEPFSTPCPPQAASYSFGFETEEGALNGAFPTSECWKRISSSSYPAVYNYSAKTGSQSLRFYGSGTQYAILPQFNEDVKGLTLSFYYFNYSWGGALSVGYMTDPEDAGTFVLLQDLANITAYAAAATEINLSTADAGARYIAFKYVGSESYHYSILDDVVVEKALSCQKPTDVLVSDVTATTAVVDWTENNSAEAWKLQISTNNVDWTDVNGGANITDKPYTLTGLTANHTTYYVRVKSVCGGSDASNWSAASDPFETDCAASALPFNDDFSGADLGCWTKEHCYSSTGLYNGTFMFYYNNTWSGEEPPQYLISPEINTENKPVTVEFDYYMYSGTETFKVGYSTTTNDVSAFTWGNEISCTNTSSATPDSYSENFPAGVKYVAIMHTSNDQYYLYIDNFSVAEYVAPACPAINAATLEESNVTAHTATVSWTAGGEETAWNLQYKAAGGEWSDVIAISTTPSYDMAGLAENTVYYVRVQANCGEDLSEWTGDEAFSFPTDCEPKTVSKASPWNYGFEDTNDGSMPSCWERTEPYANYGYPVVAEYSYYAQSGDKYLYLRTPGRSGSSYTEDAILPVFNTEIKNLKVSFSYFNGAATSNYGQLAIGYVVGDAFTQVGELLAQVEDYTLVEREMPNDAPNGARIAVRCIGSTKGSSYTTTAYLDDIQVSLKPTCYVPTGLAAEATSTGAMLSWTAGKEESEWSVRYSIKDADSWTVVDEEIVATNYTLAGLSTENTYEVQVKAVCGASDESEWSASVEFTPACDAPTALAVTARTQNSATFSWTSNESAFELQYSADGENWSSENVATNPFTLTGLAAGQAYQAKIKATCSDDFSNVVEFITVCAMRNANELPLNEDFNSIANGALPACWESATAAVEVGGEATKLFFRGADEQIVILPGYDINLNELTVSFDYTTNNNAKMQFGYVTSLDGEFNLIAELEDASYDAKLPATLAIKGYLAFRYYNGGTWSAATIDNVHVAGTLVLNDNVDNSAALSANNGKTVDVVIGRKIVRKGYYNTICLPFSLSAEEFAASPIATDDLWAFRYAKVDEATDELLFRIIESDHIEAGVPYFIGFEENEEDIINPLFKNVTISATEGEKIGDASVAQLCGIVEKPVVFNAGDQSKLFLAANNTLYWWAGDADSKLNNFRAYFKVATSGVNGAPLFGMPARIVKEHNSTTGVDEINGQNTQAMKILENKQVIIIRNGVKYNVQGQIIEK